ncbi:MULTISPECIES: NAD(P)/FAD-dependent oxidoreductase [unclassified Novosphingobium]|uniref:FAD-dependent oxidoreductase n=1 Tax=unclassified Novosphingobium TaxID=2644732 RepID=UPI00020EEA2A|nr:MULTISPECIES: NAD(P)/FAD-dependent oxidoreductase [unclassified Novosphingobium]GFM27474.1 monooxygenase FAD-binding [Novosphingobium sp. PY1]CCA91984.1 monooxygenase FAD-binding [Novosphingobium sp. PP1Y]
MSSIRRTQVVVAGGGPVGSVAAAYLAKHGIDVVLAETGADCAQDLRASTFHPPTLEMLDELDVTPALIEMGLKAPVYHWRDRRSGEILPFDLSEISDVTRYPFRIQCEQYHLARMLTERLAKLDRAQVLFNHRVVHFKQDETGVDVDLESPFGIETIRADYLIGADGASSIVRKWLGTEFDGFTYPERFLTLSTTWPIEEAMKGLAYVNYVSDPEEWLVLLRVPSVWRVLVPAHEESEDYLRSDEKKNAVFDGIMGDGAAVETQHRTIYRVHQRVAKQFRHGRVLLMGDSAHLNNPLGGFGMNSGIHDAFNACSKLVEIIKDGAPDKLLDLYDRQRRKVTFDFTQRQTMDNMEAMRATQDENHRKREAAMRALLEDDEKRRAYLLRQAMFESLDQAAAIV